MITAIQGKMARGAMDWSLREVAERAGVNINTVIRFEAGSDPKSSKRDAIEEVFLAEGFVFSLDGYSITAPKNLKPVYKQTADREAA